MEKHITVIPGEGGQLKDLAIRPGTTAAEVLQAAGLGQGYVLSTGRGTEALGQDENIYPVVQEGSKLYAVTPVSVGSVVEVIARRIAHTNSEIQRIQQQRQVLARFLQPRPITVVPRDQRPYWQQRGWTTRWGTSTGYFRTRFGSWKGKATTSISGRIELYIHDPPDVLHQHPRWMCFHVRPDRWYFIHTHGMDDLSSGILRIETILIEAHSHAH